MNTEMAHHAADRFRAVTTASRICPVAASSITWCDSGP
jgi:hypothetical protein